MAEFMFTPAKRSLMEGELDWADDDIWVMLTEDGWAPSPALRYLSAATTHELGYVLEGAGGTRQELLGRTAMIDGVQVRLSADTVVWPDLFDWFDPGDMPEVGGAIIYRNIDDDDAVSEMLFWVPLAGVLNGETVNLSFPLIGVARLL